MNWQVVTAADVQTVLPEFRLRAGSLIVGFDQGYVAGVMGCTPRMHYRKWYEHPASWRSLRKYLSVV